MVDWKDGRLWAFLIPVLIVAVFLGWAVSPLAGTKIVLETRGVDPPDLFRGDYMQLAYPIADMDRDEAALRGLGDVEAGDTVYLVLAEGPRADPGGAAYWEVRRVDQARPEVAKDEVCIRAQVDHASPRSIHVTMGIESYFIQKDQEFDAWWDADEVSVEVHVKGCDARLTAVRLDGERWDG